MTNENLRLTNDEFINRSCKIHGAAYDYSKAHYVNYLTKVTIICNTCGLEFQQIPANHYHGEGCPNCRWDKMGKSRINHTGAMFKEKAENIHGDKYDYSKVIYTSAHDPITIICKTCGIQFEQAPTGHLGGHGCFECWKAKTSNDRRDTLEDFIEKARGIHGNKYDYSGAVYVNAATKIVIKCSKHGNFEQTPNGHLAGRGCVKCRFSGIIYKSSKRQLENLKKARQIHKESGKTNALTQNEFIEKSMQAHGNRYNYSKAIYRTAKENIIIICPIHGEFSQEAYHHTEGVGCPRCSFSKGELAVAKVLDILNIHYEQEKKFPECKDKRPLQFDFYFVYCGLHFLVEYQGVHHYKPVKFFEREGHAKHEWYKQHDDIKRKFASQFGFILIEIPYTQKDIQGFLTAQIQIHIQDKQLSCDVPRQLSLF